MMSETTLQDPFFAEETYGYRRDLGAEMLIRSYENQVKDEIDADHSESTRYILSQLDKDELAAAIAVMKQEIKQMEKQ